jgi:outer membrane protein assembly factor BamB
MEFDFGFESSGFDDFDVEVEEFVVVKLKKMDRHLRTGAGGSITATPMLHNGIAYFGSHDGYAYAVDAETGAEMWRFKTDGKIFSTPAINTQGHIFFGSYDGNLYSVNSNGELIWRFKTGAEIASSPCVCGKMVLIGSNDGCLYAVDTTEGKEMWRFKTGDWIGSSPLVSEGKVYFGSYDGFVYCLNLDGKELWRFKMGAEIWGLHESPRMWKGVLYFASMDSNLYAVNAETGKEIWRANTGKYGNAIQPFVNDDYVLQPSRDGVLFAFDRKGKELWRFNLGNLPAGTVVHDGKIYIGNESGVFRCLSLEGRELWSFQAGAKIFGGPLFFNGNIIFGSYDCHIYSLTPSGQESWRFVTSNPQPISMPPAHDAFRLEVKKSGFSDDSVDLDKYKEKKGSRSDSLSNYSIKSDYASTSDYKTKSDYDTNFVIIEESNIMEDLVWTSDSTLIPHSPILMSK